MKLTRRTLATALGLVPLALASPRHALAQAGKTSAVIGMVLEPTSLDPTMAPAAAIGEVVHLNVLEGLVKINENGQLSPLLAERWTLDPDGKSLTLALRRGVKFHDGEPFDASAVKFSFERAKDKASTNKAKKALFDNVAGIAAPDPFTVILTLDHPDGNLLFRLGENPAVILHPKSAASAATQPIGTGPYRFADWKKGSSITLLKFDGFRNAAQVRLNKVVFRFISDPAAQVAALLAGDVDAFPRGIANQSLKPFQADKRFAVQIGSTAGKGILAINNKRKPFDDVRVRRAIAHAIDRKAIIDGVLDGLGQPIGSHFAPTDAGYLDLTSMYPFDPEKAKALLKEAGVKTPLDVTLTLPPPPYARKGGEVVAAQLAKVGIHARIDNVEWAQWLSGAYKGQFDLTLINHVEPLDYLVYTDPSYYYGYDSKPFRDLVARHAASTNLKERGRLFADIQRMLATDCVNAYLFNPQQALVARKGLKGLWANSPIFANDLAAVRWE
jgi:peptide/nickel transport system substrate-binding protein